MGDEVTRNEGTLTGCREAVEILTRIPKKGTHFPPLFIYGANEHPSFLRRQQGRS